MNCFQLRILTFFCTDYTVGNFLPILVCSFYLLFLWLETFFAKMKWCDKAIIAIQSHRTFPVSITLSLKYHLASILSVHVLGVKIPNFVEKHVQNVNYYRWKQSNCFAHRQDRMQQARAKVCKSNVKGIKRNRGRL